MNNLNVSLLVVLTIIVLFLFYYAVQRDINAYSNCMTFYSEDDGERRYICEIIEQERQRRKKKASMSKIMIKSSRDGLIRGFIVGYSLAGLPGAFNGAITWSIIGPVMAGIDGFIPMDKYIDSFMNKK